MKYELYYMYDGDYVIRKLDVHRNKWLYLKSYRPTGPCRAVWSGNAEQAKKYPYYYECAEILKWLIDQNPHIVTKVTVEID